MCRFLVLALSEFLSLGFAVPRLFAVCFAFCLFFFHSFHFMFSVFKNCATKTQNKLIILR